MSFLPVDTAEYEKLLPYPFIGWMVRNDVFCGELPTATEWTGQCHFPVDDLRSVHPDLPAALTHLSASFAHYNGGTPCYVDIDMVYAQMQYLLNPLQIPNHDGSLSRVLQVRAIAWDGKTDVASVNAAVYVMHTSLPASAVELSMRTQQVAPYVAMTRGALLEIPVDWLEQQAPGWKDRYLTGVELGLSMRELITYSCASDQPALPVVTLPELGTFSM